MEQQELIAPSLVYVTDTWKPDLARFRQEVQEARETGVGDGLTLAEMECCLDLIDADLVALLAARKSDQRTLKSIEETTALKAELAELIRVMRPYCRD